MPGGAARFPFGFLRFRPCQTVNYKPVAKSAFFPQNLAFLHKGSAMSRRSFYTVAFAIFLALAIATVKAEAHAIILESDPKSGAIVAAGAVPVKLHFNSRIDHARSIITLIDQGKQQTKLPIAPGSAPAQLETTTGDLAPGAYRIRWQVLSIDGHITRGDIPFTVQ